METVLAIILFVLAAGYLYRRLKRSFEPGQSPCAGCSGCSAMPGQRARRCPSICDRP